MKRWDFSYKLDLIKAYEGTVKLGRRVANIQIEKKGKAYHRLRCSPQ